MADYAYAAVTNIPSNYHASDLRAHFSELVETKSFICFHFRHRPEKRRCLTRDPNDNDGRSKSPSPTSCDTDSVRSCCIVKVVQTKLQQLLKYNGNNWTNADCDISEVFCNVDVITLAAYATDETEVVDEEKLLHMPELNPPDKMPNGNVGTPTLVFLDMIRNCLLPQTLIKKLQLQFPKTEGRRIYSNVKFDYCTRNMNNSTRGENDQKRLLTDYSESNISNQCETKTSHPKCIKSRQKLIQDPVPSTTDDHPVCNEQFSAVDSERGLEVETSVGVTNCLTSHNSGEGTKFAKLVPSNTTEPPQESSKTDFKQPNKDATSLLSAQDRKRRKRAERQETRKLMAEGIEERLIAIDKRYHNDDDAEEWDRHEASEDDPSNQERNKERLYETEEETPWEKGGPGVVFYTDANFWQAREGDFDEQTTDDLDVDFSAYEEAGAGDRDIKDFLRMRQSERFRSGYDKTDRFSIGIAKRLQPTRSSGGTSHNGKESKTSSHQQTKIGEFEKFSKGVGRRVMERQGWQEGQGLGSSQPGIVTALVAEGQAPKNKCGLGYKAPSHPLGLAVLRRKQEPHLISTIYDDPRESDPKVPLLQREEPTTLKHRHSTKSFPPT